MGRRIMSFTEFLSEEKEFVDRLNDINLIEQFEVKNGRDIVVLDRSQTFKKLRNYFKDYDNWVKITNGYEKKSLLKIKDNVEFLDKLLDASIQAHEQIQHIIKNGWNPNRYPAVNSITDMQKIIEHYYIDMQLLRAEFLKNRDIASKTSISLKGNDITWVKNTKWDNIPKIKLNESINENIMEEVSPNKIYIV